MSDDYDQNLSALIRYGVSAELIGLLQSIAESRRSDGNERYMENSCKNLQKLVLCRNINTSLWRLANLLAAVEATQPRGVADLATVSFFWYDERITPGRFQEAFSKPLTAGDLETHWEDDGLHIRYGDGSVFVIPRSNINYLAALLEFVWFIDTGLEGKLKELRDRPTAKAVEGLSKRLQSRMNAYLNEHTQPLQQQRKGRYLLQWLAAQPDARQASTDELVLRFWRSQANATEFEFKLFNTVVQAFQTLSSALQVGRDVLAGEDYSLSIGANVEAGEIDLDRLDAHFDELLVETSKLSKLAQPPLDDIKFLTAKDAKFVAHIDAAGAQRTKVPLSLMRSACFGAQQVVIGQNIRKKRHDMLPGLIGCSDTEPYSNYIDRIGDFARKLDVTRLCVLHILLELEHEEAMAHLVQRLSTDGQASFARLLNQDAEHVDLSRIRKTLPRIALQLPELNDLLRSARLAFEKTNRHGLANMPDPVAANAYADGANVLEELAATLDSYRAAVTRAVEPYGGLESVFSADLKRFREVFALLYGAYL